MLYSLTPGAIALKPISENTSANHLVTEHSPLWGRPLLVVSAAAFLVIFPFFLLGLPSGHDFEFHLNSWMEVVHQWKQGVLYPRWADLAHFGYGEARFVFYPPASWLLGAALGAVLPWKLVPGVYIWIALTLSGSSMFLLARRWLDRGNAIFAAALYAANPYYIVLVYWRSAYAELLAGALLPLLLLFILRLEEEAWRAAIPLGLVVAAAWLTNAPSAVMVSYSLLLLVVVNAVARRSPGLLLYGGVAALMGLGLAAFYILPAAYEQKWVDISQVLSLGVRPQDNFLFTHIADPFHYRFNLLMSFVACGEFAVLAAAIVGSRRKRHQEGWWSLAAWAAVSSLLMFSFTLFLWEYLPKLRFVQLTWRWLLCLNVALALLVIMAWRQWWARLLAYAFMFAVLGFVWQRVQPPWWDHASDIALIENSVASGTGYEGTDEYVPVDGDAYEINKTARKATLDGPGTAQIRVLEWDTERKIFLADVSEPTRLALHLFYYPAWKVEVNGHGVEPESRDVTGQMLVPLAPGKNEVWITFMRTWDRALGVWISIASLFVVGGWALKLRIFSANSATA